MKYFVAVALPGTLRDSIDSLRARYPGRLNQHLEPHITLLPPIDVVDERGWLEGLTQTAKNCARFPLQLGQPAQFGQRVLYLSVVSELAPLSALRAALKASSATMLQDLDEPMTDERPFHPHVTLAMTSFGTTNESMAQMSTEASGDDSLHTAFIVQAVRVYVRAASGWQTLADLPLHPDDTWADVGTTTA